MMKIRRFWVNYLNTGCCLSVCDDVAVPRFFSVSLCINLIFDLNEYYFILTFHLNVWLWMKAPNLLCMLSSYRKCTMKMDRPISQIGVHVLHAVYTLPITQYNLTTVWNFLLPIKFVKLLFHFYMFKKHAFAFMFIVDWP